MHSIRSFFLKLRGVLDFSFTVISCAFISLADSNCRRILQERTLRQKYERDAEKFKHELDINVSRKEMIANFDGSKGRRNFTRPKVLFIQLLSHV